MITEGQPKFGMGPAHVNHPDHQLYFTEDNVRCEVKDAELFKVESVGYGNDLIPLRRVLKIINQCEAE